MSFLEDSCKLIDDLNEDEFPRVVLSGVFKRKIFASYGLRVYCVNTDRWLMVKRRHSVEYCILIRGTYHTHHLPILIPKLTSHERKSLHNVLKLNSDDYVKFIVECVGIEYYDIDCNRGWHALNANKEKISVLISNTYPKVTLWTWPKGVKENHDENGYVTAMREFNEEVAPSLPPPLEEPSEDPFIRKSTFYGREIHEHFWTYVVEKEFPIREEVTSEVQKRKWKHIT
jgi:hypothetical protein